MEGKTQEGSLGKDGGCEAANPLITVLLQLRILGIRPLKCMTRHFAAPPALRNSARATVMTWKPADSSCAVSSLLMSLRMIVLPMLMALHAKQIASYSVTAIRFSAG